MAISYKIAVIARPQQNVLSAVVKQYYPQIIHLACAQLKHLLTKILTAWIAQNSAHNVKMHKNAHNVNRVIISTYTTINVIAH